MKNIDYQSLQEQLCRELCANVHIKKLGELYLIEVPLYFPDGDAYQIYIEEVGAGGIRLTDKGNLLMRLSYEMDTKYLFEGSRDMIRQNILSEMGMAETDEGEFYYETSVKELAEAIFIFGQGLTKLHDLLFLSRSRVASAFYDDLWESLRGILGGENIKRDYEIGQLKLKDRALYAVHFCFAGKNDTPVYLFGVGSGYMARLVTICLQHYRKNNIEFDSLIVFEDQETISKKDMGRLMNVGEGFISSLDGDDEEFKRKILSKAATSPSIN